jgi:hypothetical protein
MERVLAKARLAVQTSGHLFDTMDKEYVTPQSAHSAGLLHGESLPAVGS